MNIKNTLKETFQNRLAWPALQIVHLMVLFTLLRVALMATFWSSLDHGVGSKIWAFWIGARMDLAISFIFTVPVLLIYALLPNRFFARRWFVYWLGAGYVFFLFWMTFFNVADFFFFDEFNARLNYVAVDYLFMSPGEVVGNIWQSYPVPAVLLGVGAFTALLFWPVRSLIFENLAKPVALKIRIFVLTGVLLAAAFFHSTVDIKMLNADPNRILDEIAANGFYTFFYALLTNNLDYASQYLTKDPSLMVARLKNMVVQPDEQAVISSPNPLERIIPKRAGGLGNMNVVIILEESLGAKFVGSLGSDLPGLTPNLDRWSKKGLFFRRFYSTGTRTVRGLEAVLSSFPPIPGTSIVKRSNNENVTTLAREFKRRGYDTSFIYGGRGLFDGMRSFMLPNGFDRFIEQKHYPTPTYTTIWGVCDEDIFHKSLEEFDALHAANKKFFSTILTVSNHKPYAYPKGRIDLDPDAHSRNHAVKYADFALGEFLDQASTHAFFKDTLFVILGDHGARVYGADFIPILSYEIPLLMLAPAHLAPAKIDTLGCSMDVGPTLLGILGEPYQSVFFGRDILRLPKEKTYVLLQHDRDVGFFDGNLLSVLSTRNFAGVFQYDATRKNFTRIENPNQTQQELISNAVAFYQTAYALYTNGDFRVHAE